VSTQRPMIVNEYGGKDATCNRGGGSVVGRHVRGIRCSTVSSAVMDMHRMVWGLSYAFTDRISLHTEVDFEHAARDMELEFAYLDFAITPAFNFRAGSLLMPVGPLNELHEPTLFYSVERPYVQAYIVPTTWQEGGAGVFGSLGGLKYRVYLVSGLDAAKFTPDQGLRGGRGKVNNAPSEDLAVVGRLEYVGLPGVDLGLSAYQGGANPAKNPAITGADVRILEADARLRAAGLDLRGVVATVAVDAADQISAVASARPSISPTMNALAPSTPTRNRGKRLWIISDEISISMLTKPSTHTPVGILPSVVVALVMVTIEK